LLKASQVIILPNNPNIILAAEQVAAMCDKEVRVVPTRSLAQTIGALVAFDPEASLETNMTAMSAGSTRVKSGEVTFAVRDCQLDGLDIAADQIIGIYEKDIKAVGEDVSGVVLDLLKIMVTEEDELISLFYGEGVETERAERLAEQVRELFPSCEVEMHSGGQPLYFYFISVE
jgi:dihydroxyacetone kinase-like predicted kinase